MQLLKFFCGPLLNILFIWSASSEIVLEHLKTVYIPFRYGPEEYLYNEGVAEQLAVNEDYTYVYTIGNNFIHVIDFSDPTSAKVIHHEEVMVEGEGSLEDITICKDWIAVNVDNTTSPLHGKVMIYTRYDANNNPPMERIFEEIVGAVPDSSIFTSDCSKLLVAVEAEPRFVNGQVLDPEGGVALLDFGGMPNPQRGVTVQFLNFHKFNNRETEYVTKGIRKSYNGQGTSDLGSTTLSQDLEPENIAISPDDRHAYVPLQEANAIAVLDIAAANWVDLYPMGYKNYSSGNPWNNKLDASDKDGEIIIRNWPIRAFYQPDGLKMVMSKGKKYLITANEGDIREFTTDDTGLDTDWSEASRGNDLQDDGLLSDSIPNSIKALLNDNEMLGRLHFSTTDGLDNSGKIETLYTFGGRSVSIFSVDDDFSLVYDTGSELESKIAELYPDIFNGDAKKSSLTPEDTFDTRSDNRGCEPEIIEHGTVNNIDVIFVGVERPGLIAVYTMLHDGNAESPELQFESLYYESGMAATWEDLYEQRKVKALDVEDIRFISADKSSRDDALLIVAGSVSGTVSFYDVRDVSASNIGSRSKISSPMLLVICAWNFLLMAQLQKTL